MVAIIASLVLLVLGFILDSFSFITIRMSSTKSRILILKGWRRWLETRLPILQFLRRRTTEEKQRMAHEAKYRSQEPPQDPVSVKFQKACGEVSALQMIQDDLNIYRASRGGRDESVSPGALSPEYRDGFMKACERLEAQVAKRKDGLVWWLIRHGAEPDELTNVVVSLPMVEKIAKRFGAKLDHQDPLAFVGEVQIDPSAAVPKTWWERQKERFEARDKKHEEKILDMLQDRGSEDRPTVQVDDVFIPIEIIRGMAGGPWYTVDGVVCALWPRPYLDPVDLRWPHRPWPPMTYREMYIFVPETIIKEAIAKYPPKA